MPAGCRYFSSSFMQRSGVLAVGTMWVGILDGREESFSHFCGVLFRKESQSWLMWTARSRNYLGKPS
jgi:hypothetical protein